MVNQKSRSPVLLGVIAAAMLAVASVPAKADVEFTFGTSYGNSWHGHHGWGHGWGHHDFYRPAFSHHYWHDDYYPRRRETVVFWNPPVTRTIVQPVYVNDDDEALQGRPGRVISRKPYCREYQRDVRVGGHIEQSYGTACRQPDGDWKIVNEDE